MSSNKRKHERVKPLDHFLVIDQQTGDFIGRVVNMSSGGLKLIGANPVEKEKIYQCQMTLPQEFEGETMIEFEACCKWSEKNEFMKMYETGFEITKCSEQEKKILTELIEKWCGCKTGTVKA